MGLSSPTDIPGLRNRFLVCSLAAIAIFLLLMLRLWYLQVISADRYLTLSEKNRIRYISIAAARGPIFDRNGELLVDNRPAFGVSVLRQEVEEIDPLLTQVGNLLEVDVESLRARWDAGQRFPRYRPLPLAEDVSRDALDRVQENSVDLPGMLIEVRPLRSYPYKEMAAHLLGYLGEITEQELQEEAFAGYRPGEFVGKSGLEKFLDPYLQGTEGERRVEVDVRGRELRLLKTQEPTPGNKVFLTLRRDMQLAAEKALEGEAGAVVALDVRTGEVLAMASTPAFDPAAFARGITGQEWVKILKNPRHPLTNKAIKGQYPPASTFKIVTALAALKGGVVSPSTTVDCQGSVTLGNQEFRCWKKGGHGPTNLKKALKESCDVYFYMVSLDLGIDRLSAMAQDLGMGQPLGFLLDGEKGGLIPTRQWKRERFHVPWYDGETVIASIGQGYVLATPMQLAVMTAAIANGGTGLRPHVLKKIEDLDGKILRETVPEVIGTALAAEKDFREVRRGLEAAVNEPGGTGQASRLQGVRVAGKTGTAQVVRLKDDTNPDREIPYRFRDHALFVAYAPAEKPEIAVAVVVEHGSHGGSTAGPVARVLFESYFGIENSAGKSIPVPENGSSAVSGQGEE